MLTDLSTSTLFISIFVIVAIGFLRGAHLLGLKSQKKMAHAVREFPNFIVSKQFFCRGGFIAFDLKSRVIVYVETVFSKPILINAEDIVVSGKYEPEIVEENSGTTNASNSYQVTVLTKTGVGIEFKIPFTSREQAVECLSAIHEITEKKKLRNNKVENAKFLINALKLQVSKNGQEGQLLKHDECLQYIDYLLINIRTILFRDLARGDNSLIAKAMFDSFGGNNQRWFRGRFSENTLGNYVSKRKTALGL